MVLVTVSVISAITSTSTLGIALLKSSVNSRSLNTIYGRLLNAGTLPTPSTASIVGDGN